MVCLGYDQTLLGRVQQRARGNCTHYEGRCQVIREIARVIIFLVLLLTALYFLLADSQQRTVRYDCTMASFHPDIPPAAKEACRTRKAPSP